MKVKDPIRLVLLTGRVSLRSSGPIGKKIVTPASGVRERHDPIRDIEVGMVASMPNVGPISEAPAPPSPALVELPPAPTDLVGPGDVLDISIYLEISIYEAGVTYSWARAAQAGPRIRSLLHPPCGSRNCDLAGWTIMAGSIPCAGTMLVAGIAPIRSRR